MGESLFGEDIDERVEQAEEVPKFSGPFAGVALENSLDRVLDYAIPPKLIHELAVGQRVRVPLGRNNRPALGYVVSIHPTTNYPKIKALSSIDDERVLVTPALMDLARWMSRYYCTPLGTVLDSVIPSAVKKKVGVGYSQMVRVIKDPIELQAIFEKTKAAKRRAILARLLQLPVNEPIEIHRLAEQAGTTPPTIRKLRKLGWITITAQAEYGQMNPAPNGDGAGGDEKPIELNEEQRAVMNDLLPRIKSGGFSVNLLFGVTGSGKTEIYLQSLSEIVNRGQQAIVLVPEIALTPQTARRFTARFKRVAILHSGLSQTDRHRFWQMIASGEADVVVGARSAIFGPVPNLGMIVVDEEHESSYKQDTAPRYHARDVAIKRAQTQGVPVLLGSATPSLETWSRTLATAGHGQPAKPSYHVLNLPHRVRGLAMPHVELIDMKREGQFRRGIHLISQRLEHLLRVTLETKRQAILLLNRRGYSNFIYCNHCQDPIHCKFCDTTMTYHRSAAAHAHGGTNAEGVHTGQMHCHYCLAVLPLPDKCPACSKKLSLFGLGTQRVEEELARKFPDLVYARVDSDTMRSARDYEALLGKFGRGEVQVLLGTQMIAKGLDYPNVTLVGVISGDTALALPDFRAAERTF
jgi:primosomal protein N' (replication factor Y)